MKKALNRLVIYFPLLVAGGAAFSLSTLFSAMKPVLLTRFVEQVGLDESLAGLIVAMPFVGIACASFVARRLVNHISMRKLALIFGSLLVAGELFSAYFFTQIYLILLVQFACGVSVGILMGATSKRVATTQAPDQLFGFVDMTAVLFMSFMITGVGFAVSYAGLQGGYQFAAVVSFGFVCLMLFYREESVNNDPEGLIRHSKLALSVRPIAVVAMGIIFVTASGMGFAFMFSIAIGLGMDYGTAGSFIGTLVLFSAAACPLGGWCSSRFGPIKPLACAYIACGIGWYFAINAESQWMFMVALIPAIFSLQFNFPILLALSGSLDDEGQWAAITSPLLTSGFAWAAITAGFIVSLWGVAALAWGTLIGMAICLLLLFPARSDPLS